MTREHRSSPDPDYWRQKNNKLVWDETVRIMTDLFDNVWGDRSEVVVDHCADITLPVCSLWHRFYPCHNTAPPDCRFRHWRRRYWLMPRSVPVVVV